MASRTGCLRGGNECIVGGDAEFRFALFVRQPL
jgi:hypothetical protein